MQTMKTIILILICTVLLGACGNKGPLYLPDGKSTAKLATPIDDETDEEEKEDDGSAPL